MKTQMETLADIEANIEIRSTSFEELNNRLLKGKIDLGDVIREQERKRVENNQSFYFSKLNDFLINIKNYLKNCFYCDDKSVKEIINYLDIQIGITDTSIVMTSQTYLNIKKDLTGRKEDEKF